LQRWKQVDQKSMSLFKAFGLNGIATETQRIYMLYKTARFPLTFGFAQDWRSGLGLLIFYPHIQVGVQAFCNRAIIAHSL
jgi:hypothetical protein